MHLFTIEYNLITNAAHTISVVSFDGKKVFNASVENNLNTVQKIIVDCGYWTRGIYFVIIKDVDDNILLTKQIVLVQR